MNLVYGQDDSCWRIVEVATPFIDEVLKFRIGRKRWKHALKKIFLPLNKLLGKRLRTTGPTGDVSLFHALHENPAQTLSLFARNHDNFPRLYVDGRWRLSCKREQSFKGFLLYRLVQETPGAPSFLNGFDDVHITTSHVQFLVSPQSRRGHRVSILFWPMGRRPPAKRAQPFGRKGPMPKWSKNIWAARNLCYLRAIR